jgi:putative transposase
MVLYRRNRVAGGTYFFTVTLRDRSSDVLVRHVGLLRDAFRSVRTERPFTIDAIVILPDHLHAMWTLPEGDADYSGRWRAIKSRFTRDTHLRHSVDPQRSRRIPAMATAVLGTHNTRRP